MGTVHADLIVDLAIDGFHALSRSVNLIQKQSLRGLDQQQYLLLGLVLGRVGLVVRPYVRRQSSEGKKLMKS